MSNTHRAVIESSVPPGLTLVGSGPKDFCEKQLAWWIEGHPLGEFETAMVLAVEPGAKPQKQDDEELTVYGYGVVDPEGKFITNFNEQQRAINYVDDARRMAKAAGLASDYRVAAIVDQGGL